MAVPEKNSLLPCTKCHAVVWGCAWGQKWDQVPEWGWKFNPCFPRLWWYNTNSWLWSPRNSFSPWRRFLRNEGPELGECIRTEKVAWRNLCLGLIWALSRGNWSALEAVCEGTAIPGSFIEECHWGCAEWDRAGSNRGRTCKQANLNANVHVQRWWGFIQMIGELIAGKWKRRKKTRKFEPSSSFRVKIA